MMIFIDGENLLLRYEAMREERGEPSGPRDALNLGASPQVTYVPGRYVWHPLTAAVHGHEIIRATYYTHVVGDVNKVKEINTALAALHFDKHWASESPHTLTPWIFHKKKDSKKEKTVDVKMTVDILTHVHHDNVDSVYLVTGDGDFLPVIKEAVHSGKNVYLAALSSGLHPDLKNYVDDFRDLDPLYFR